MKKIGSETIVIIILAILIAVLLAGYMDHKAKATNMTAIENMFNSCMDRGKEFNETFENTLTQCGRLGITIK